MELAIAAARAAASASSATSSREGRTRQPRARRRPVSPARRLPNAIGQSSRARQPLRALATPVPCRSGQSCRVRSRYSLPCRTRTGPSRPVGQPLPGPSCARAHYGKASAERAGATHPALRLLARNGLELPRARGACEVRQGRRVGPSGGAFNTDAIRIGLAIKHESCPLHKQILTMNIYLFYFLLTCLFASLFTCLSACLSCV